MRKNKKLILISILLLTFFDLRVYAKESIPDSLDKEWYCNIVKGNAISNYFKLPSIKDGLKITRDDYETNADYDDAIDYYNLENYRITLNFKTKNKVDIGWTSLLYNDNYKKSQNVVKTYKYSFKNNSGSFNLKEESYDFEATDQIINIPSQNVVCYADLIEAKKNYKLYELNENFDKSVADENGFVLNNGILTKYIGTNRKLLLPSSVVEIAKFDSDNVYYYSSLVIPSSVKKVYDEAFEYFNASEIVFSEGLEELGNEVFSDANYADIYLPKSLIKIGTKAFGDKVTNKPTFHVFKDSYAENYLKNNYSQDEINIEYNYDDSDLIIEDCKNYNNYTYKEIKSFINSEGFAIKNNILYACNKKSSDVIVPDNITTIASEAFSDYYNSNVKKIIIPSSVKKVEYNAFSFTSAKTVVFSEGLEQIESQAFADTNFKDIYLPPTINKIGKNIFSTENGLNGTNIHVEKDSIIAKYLEDNSLDGKYELKYDYQSAKELITNSSKLRKFKIIIIAAILTSLIAIIILINVLKNTKYESSEEKIAERKREKRLKSLSKNIVVNNTENSDSINVSMRQELNYVNSTEGGKNQENNLNKVPEISNTNTFDNNSELNLHTESQPITSDSSNKEELLTVEQDDEII